MILGIEPTWFADGLFLLSYLLIMTDGLHRTVLAVLAGSVMLFSVTITTGYV